MNPIEVVKTHMIGATQRCADTLDGYELQPGEQIIVYWPDGHIETGTLYIESIDSVHFDRRAYFLTQIHRVKIRFYFRWHNDVKVQRQGPPAGAKVVQT